jgi:hypothetical protein
MTLDERARLAVRGTRAAWSGAQAPTPNTVRQRQRIQRNARAVQIAVAAVAVAALVLFALLPRFFGSVRLETPAVPNPREQEKAPETRTEESKEQGPVGRPREQGEASPESRTERDTVSAPTTPGPAATACEPLIKDAKGDVDNAAIDILESSMTYDPARNTLSIRHVLDDIPATYPYPNDSLAYEFYFTLDRTSYRALAYIGPASYGEESFHVDRDDRTRSDEWPNVPARYVTSASGRFDAEADTVTMEINIDEFNAGERRASEQEGMTPAAELRRGSMLTKIHLISYQRSAGPGPTDRGAGCDYVVPGS